jgi:hypothetical protein
MGLFDFFRRKKPAGGAGGDGAEAKGERGTRHCFVLCGRADRGDLSRASEVVGRVLGPGHAVSIERGIVSISGEQASGFLAHVPAPIPNHEAEDNADGNVLWTNGKEEAARHRSHVIVTNLGSDGLTPVQSALAVSRLTLVALELFDGLGVYWGNAHVCNSRQVFESFCEDMSEELVPVPVWLRLQPVRAAQDGIGLYTLGMRQFGLMEIEVDRCRMKPQELFEFVSNIAHYLIQSGPVIADGNTVGGSEEERIVVRHRASMVEKGRRVYKIMFDK